MAELALALDPAAARRFLGYGRKGRPSRAVESRLAALWDEALALLRPRGAWRLVEQAVAEETGMPRPSEKVAAGLCTIGAELETEAARRAEAGAPLDALILDAAGSAATEAAADALNFLICEEAGKLGRYAAPRVSPGYGKWPVAFQAELLALLPAAELGVALTPGLMMVPRKSVSFAVNLLKVAPRGRGCRDRCRRCGLPNCPYSESSRDWTSQGGWEEGEEGQRKDAPVLPSSL